MSRDRAGSGLKTHPVLEHCLKGVAVVMFLGNFEV
jgi:hypothetical protein